MQFYSEQSKVSGEIVRQRVKVEIKYMKTIFNCDYSKFGKANSNNCKAANSFEEYICNINNAKNG
jgi:hypothetical protein